MKREIGRAHQFGENIIVCEALPFPYVHYTPSFLGFYKDLGTKLVFCSCSRIAIENSLEMCRVASRVDRPKGMAGWRFYRDYPQVLLRAASILASLTYPNTTHHVQSWWTSRDPILAASRIEALVRLIEFREALCHKCSKRLPYSPYGISAYIHQALYSYGLYNFGEIGLADKCPDQLKAMNKDERYRFVENEVRRALGFPRRGLNGLQEGIVFLLVSQIFPLCKVIRHFRPAWLEGLELDVFVEEHKLGVEFQGIQHFKAFDYLGGERALRQTQRRDKKKAALCETNGIKLVTINEDEEDELTDNSVYRKLKVAMPSLEYRSPYKIEKPSWDVSIYLEHKIAPAEGG